MVMAKHKVDNFHIQNTRKKREKKVPHLILLTAKTTHCICLYWAMPLGNSYWHSLKESLLTLSTLEVVLLAPYGQK
jgi:hypothetical protein